jgi:cystathionine beta-lyase
VHHFPPEATYLAWLDFRECELEGGPYRFFFERARLGLSNGESFGPGGEGFVRVNFATSRAILEEVLARMTEALEQAGRV